METVALFATEAWAAVGGSGTIAAADITAAASTVGSWLGPISSLASAGLGIAGGNQQAASMQARADLERFNAEQELLRGQQEQNAIREGLLRTLAAQNAAYGASGIDVGSGTPLDVQRETTSTADRELDISRTNALARSYARRASASALESDASATMIGGYARGGFSLLDYFDRQARIGRPATA